MALPPPHAETRKNGYGSKPAPPSIFAPELADRWTTHRRPARNPNASWKRWQSESWPTRTATGFGSALAADAAGIRQPKRAAAFGICEGWQSGPTSRCSMVEFRARPQHMDKIFVTLPHLPLDFKRKEETRSNPGISGVRIAEFCPHGKGSSEAVEGSAGGSTGAVNRVDRICVCAAER